MERIAALCVKSSHTAHKEPVRCFLQVIDLDDQIFQFLGMTEIRKCLQKITDLFAAPDHHVCHLQRVILDLLYIAHIDAHQHILHLIRHSVNMLGELHDILTLNRGDKFLCQFVQHIVLLSIGTVLDLMDLLQIFLKLLWFKISQNSPQKRRRLTGFLRTCDKIIKIVCILFSCHFLFLLLFI